MVKQAIEDEKAKKEEESKAAKKSTISPEVRAIQRAAQTDILKGEQSRLGFGFMTKEEELRQ